MPESLIGREHPAALIRTEVSRLLTSHGGLVLVGGEAGIGKTTLLAEAAAEAAERGARVFSGSCWEGDGAPDYWPWIQVVRDLARSASSEEWAAAAGTAGDSLPVLLGETGAQPSSGAAAGTAFRLHDAFTTLLVSAARLRPTVVVLDDLHWADAASLRLLDFVARHAWFEPVLVIGGYRDVEIEAAGHPARPLLLPLVSRATHIRLGGLAPAEVGALLARTTGRAPDDAVAAEVHRRTGGNPFFVEQTAQLDAFPHSAAPVGAGVRDAVEHRLSLLPAASAEMLRTAAVLGHEFGEELLAEAAGDPPEPRALLEPALATRLLTRSGTGRYAFTHDLVRESLYDALGADGRRRGHAAVLRAPRAATDLSAAARAHHARLAVPRLPPAEAVRHLLEAARDARGRLASEEAVRHYRAALALTGTDGAAATARDRAHIELDLGAALDHDGELTAARETFAAALATGRALPDPELVARAALGIQRLGNPDPGPSAEIALLDEARQGLERLETADPSLTARVLAAGSMARTHKAVQREAGLELSRAAVALARREGDAETLGWCLLAHHDAIWGPGTDQERLGVLDELGAVARRAGDRELESLAAFLRAVALLERGDPGVHGALDTFTALTERTRLPRHRYLALSRQVSLATLDGRFEEALDGIDASYAFGERVGEVDRQPMWRDQLWAVELLRGREEEAGSVARTGTPGDPFSTVLEALTAAHLGDPATALRLLPEVEATIGALPSRFQPLLLVLRAQIAALTGDARRCEEARAALTPVRDRWAVFSGAGVVWGPMTLWIAGLDAAQERWDAAVAGFTEAVASADRLGARPWSVLGRARLADALAARGGPGDTAEAAATRDAARREAGVLGMSAALEDRPGLPRTGREATVRAAPYGAAGADSAAGAEPAPPAEPLAEENIFRPEGQVWTLRYASRTVHVRDAKGLHDLRTLLGHPGLDVPARELLAPGGAATPVPHALGADPVLDEQARTAYRARLRTLDERIRAAADRGDDDRAAALDEEREALLDELRRATGLGGRPRRLGDEAERARQTVTARIRDILRRLRASHPELAAHLRDAVSTGAHCAYRPASPVHWRL